MITDDDNKYYQHAFSKYCPYYMHPSLDLLVSGLSSVLYSYSAHLDLEYSIPNSIKEKKFFSLTRH